MYGQNDFSNAAMQNANMAMQQAQLSMQGNQNMQAQPTLAQILARSTVTPPENKSMFKEIATDIKAFILEHRGIIYFIAFALILDHFFFRGAFKARLQSMADKVVTKVEEKIK